MEVGRVGSIITRRRTFKVSFSCALPTDITVSSQTLVTSVAQHVTFDVGSRAGAFSVGMGLWTDRTFSTQITEAHTVTMPDDLFFAVVIENDNRYM